MRILLVEDNPGDVRLIREAFREADLQTEIQVVEDGERALAYLRQEPPYERIDTPNLILLDLNLPRIDGKQVLIEVKSDPRLRKIPVVVLSSSRSREDVLSSYNNHANCYIAKPLTFEEYVNVAKGIEDFWVRLVALPDRAQGRAASSPAS